MLVYVLWLCRPKCVFWLICLPTFRYKMSRRTKPALVICQDFQILVSPLPHFISAGTSKVLLLHFCSALTAKDLKFRYRSSVLPSFPKMWSSASALLLCLECQRCEVLLPQFRRTFLLCIPTQFRTVFKETSQVKIETTLLILLLVKLKRFLHVSDKFG